MFLLLSEEGKSVSFATRKTWYMMWIDDPLDSTKEFVKGKDEFTVRAAEKKFYTNLLVS